LPIYFLFTYIKNYFQQRNFSSCDFLYFLEYLLESKTMSQIIIIKGMIYIKDDSFHENIKKDK